MSHPSQLSCTKIFFHSVGWTDPAIWRGSVAWTGSQFENGRPNMIHIDAFDDDPMQAGEVRNLVLRGDGPFKVSSRCFVDQPRPPGPGFLPCPQCMTRVVNAGEVATISTSRKLWSGKEGKIVIDVSNDLGELVQLEVMVRPDSKSAPTAMTA